MTMTPREIQEKQFHDAFRGYSHEEVDLFIDQVAEDYGKLYRENESYKELLNGRRSDEAADPNATQVSEAPAAAARPEPAAAPAAAPEPVRTDSEDLLKRMLVTAQETADRAVQNARNKAHQMVEEAEARAREIREQADNLSASTLEDAQRRAKDMLKSAAQEEADLRSRVEGMKNFERDFRNRLGAYIRSQLELLEKTPILASSAPKGLFDRPYRAEFAAPAPPPAREPEAERTVAPPPPPVQAPQDPPAEVPPAAEPKETTPRTGEAEDSGGRSVKDLFWGDD